MFHMHICMIHKFFIIHTDTQKLDAISQWGVVANIIDDLAKHS